MTQIVKFPDKPWAQLATIAERRGMTIAEVITEAAVAALSGRLVPQEPERVVLTPRPKPKPRTPKGNPYGRRGAIDWRDPHTAALIREWHELHRTVVDIGYELDVSPDAVRTAFKHLGIETSKRKSITIPKEQA